MAGGKRAFSGKTSKAAERTEDVSGVGVQMLSEHHSSCGSSLGHISLLSNMTHSGSSGFYTASLGFK